MERYGLRLGVGWGCCSSGAAKPWGFVVLLLWVRALDGLLWDFGDESSTLHPMEGKVSGACRSQCPHVCRDVLEGSCRGLLSSTVDAMGSCSTERKIGPS